MFPRAGAHQLGQEAFKTLLSDVDWRPFPAFPPSVRLAVVAGQPSEPGSYTIRVKAPHGNTPHFHWAQSGEYVTQITAMGPLGLEYLRATDDPRNNNS
jgi:hypothetical protein